MWFIVVIPSALSSKCGERKHWELKEHITNIEAKAAMTMGDNVDPGQELREAIRDTDLRLRVWLMRATYSGGRTTVGLALLPGYMAFDQTLSTPDIYTLARFATCHKTSAPPLPSHTRQG